MQTRVVPGMWVALCVASAVGCGDAAVDAGGVRDGTISLFDARLGEVSDGGPESDAHGDAASADVSAPRDAVSLADADVMDALDAIDSADVAAAEVTPDVPDADAVTDAAAETDAAEDTLPAVLTCPVAPMDQTYSGLLPPNPYGAWPAAPPCVQQPHDAIIVLGCPSNEDGTPSSCQISRAMTARRLRDTGYGDDFIVSGGAVHNAHVEAEALRDLLLSGGVDAAKIHLEPQAEHTDENLYYATRIMLTKGWRSALVVSDDPGHLMMTALCDSNCCVDLGRLTVFAMPVIGGLDEKVGHYVLIPPAPPIATVECTTIQGPLKFMCTQLASRKACKASFQL